MNKKLNTLVKNGILTDTSTLKKNSYANLFDVVEKGDQSYFNICKNVNFNNNDYIDESLYTSYMIQEGDAWPTISYKFYETTELWWLICRFNDIKDPFKEFEVRKDHKDTR